jgi:Protein of unknown function DUF262
MKISTILDKIDENQLFGPAFQREYVWKRDDAKQLLDSLIKEYLTGTMLTWEFLLRMARFDSFNATAQPQPPHHELAQVEQRVSRGKGTPVSLRMTLVRWELTIAWSHRR